MKTLTFQQIATMQYTIAILLAIVSFQAARIFRESAFHFVSFGWLANLAYLTSASISPKTAAVTGIGMIEPSPGALFDFISNSLFWYAAYRYRRGPTPFLSRKLPPAVFCLLPTSLYILSLTIARLLPQQRYSSFVLATVPAVLLDTIALVSLAFYFKELLDRVATTVHRRALLFGSTIAYACIQPLQLLAHDAPRARWDIFPLAFGLGFIAKILILLGMVRVFVAFAATVTDAIAERKRAEQFVQTIDRVAHELGTPVGEIQSILVGLVEDRPSGLAVATLKSLESASQRMAAILGSLMMDVDPVLAVRRSNGSWSKDEPAKRQVTNVNTLIEVAKNAVKRVRVEKALYSHEYSAGCCITCVPNEIVQIMINLLRNAYDSSSQGTLQVHIRTVREKTTVPDGGGSDENVRLIVKDTGEGISADNLPKIFQQGFSTRRGSGRGFGLAIVKDLTEKNAGRVEVFSPPRSSSTKSKEDHGTEVVLTFPRVPCVH